MTIATVVTRGFGTFGTVNGLPTLGYISSTKPVAKRHAIGAALQLDLRRDDEEVVHLAAAFMSLH